METKELTHNFKVVLRVLGIQKRKRKVKQVCSKIGYTTDTSSIEREKFIDIANKWLHDNMREVHSDGYYLEFIEAKTVQYGDDENNVMETNLPFSELNTLIKITDKL